MHLQEAKNLCQELHDHFDGDWFKKEDAIAFIGEDGHLLMNYLHRHRVEDWQLAFWPLKNLFKITKIG